jgi:hypothetical protein
VQVPDVEQKRITGVAVMVVPLEKVSYLIVRRRIKLHGYGNQ